jgi:hypothetical protein
MSVQRFVYDSERQRHERFVGRAELLARLNRLLVDPNAVMGSSAYTAPSSGGTWPWVR